MVTHGIYEYRHDEGVPTTSGAMQRGRFGRVTRKQVRLCFDQHAQHVGVALGRGKNECSRAGPVHPAVDLDIAAAWTQKKGDHFGVSS